MVPPYPVTSVAAGGEEVGWWHPVTGEESVHVCGGSVARVAGVDDDDVAAGSAEDEGGGQSGGSATDHEDVVGAHAGHRGARCAEPTASSGWGGRGR